MFIKTKCSLRALKHLSSTEQGKVGAGVCNAAAVRTRTGCRPAVGKFLRGNGGKVGQSQDGRCSGKPWSQGMWEGRGWEDGVQQEGRGDAHRVKGLWDQAKWKETAQTILQRRGEITGSERPKCLWGAGRWCRTPHGPGAKLHHPAKQHWGQKGAGVIKQEHVGYSE